jgi:hypothetical protein
MSRSFALRGAFVAGLLLAGCSDSNSPNQPAPVGGSAGQAQTTAGTGGSGGSAAGTSGTGGDAGSGLTSGSGGSAGSVTAGTGGEATGGTAGSGGSAGGATEPPSGPFTCSHYIGAYLTMEWWNAGFEDQVDDSKWQLKWHHHGHVTEWNDPNSPFWADEGDPNNDEQGSPIQSPCAQNSATPDRVVFLAIDWVLDTEEEWITGLNDCVVNIKAKYPSAQRIEIVTLTRCPDNGMCNENAAYGDPGANDSAALQDCYVPPYVDSAIQKVVAADPGILAIGPELEMAECRVPPDGAHMTGEGNAQAATDYATYYNAHP